MKRRILLMSTLPALGCAGVLAQPPGTARPLTKRIPSSGEEIPVIGLGSWITFNVGTIRRPEPTAPR
jgi:hypothetical protein